MSNVYVLMLHLINHQIKEALDMCNIIPQLFPKKSWDFYIIRSVGMGNDCMLSFIISIDLLLKKNEFFWHFLFF